MPVNYDCSTVTFNRNAWSKAAIKTLTPLIVLFLCKTSNLHTVANGLCKVSVCFYPNKIYSSPDLHVKEAELSGADHLWLFQHIQTKALLLSGRDGSEEHADAEIRGLPLKAGDATTRVINLYSCNHPAVISL